MKRSKVTEGLSLASSAKITVAENAMNGNAFEAGWDEPLATPNVKSVKIDPADGHIIITFTAAVEDDATLMLSPLAQADSTATTRTALVKGTPAGGAIAWVCAGKGATVPAGANVGSLNAKYAPSSCR